METKKQNKKLDLFRKDHAWLCAVCVRAIKTMAQTAVSLITVGNLITDMDWLAILSISATAGISSVLTSLAGIPEAER